MGASAETVNGVPISDIVNPLDINDDLVERIAFRKVKAPVISIEAYDPDWPVKFQHFKSILLSAFDQKEPAGYPAKEGTSYNETTPAILAINHVGSTSIPGLPAKAVIDIDLVLSSCGLSAEPYYIPRLESAGFQFLLREPYWHQHRFLAAHEPMSCNLHVFGPGSPEVERHRIFREYLIAHEDEREVYAKIKREAAAISRDKGELITEYNYRKQDVLREILDRAMRELGYVK
jgi:GrpB-like predicted nucleotidyltransferase (UPF0157 family)